MPSPIDEFGSISLESLLSTDDGDIPELETVGDFSGGILHVSASANYTDTHLVTLFTLHDCACCHSLNRVAIGYAVRRLHHSRNKCIEYQSILPDMYHFFDHLPKAFKEHNQTDPFCLACATCAGFTLDADTL